MELKQLNLKLNFSEFFLILNIPTWRTLQAICACHQICSWSTIHGTQKFHPMVKEEHYQIIKISSGARACLSVVNCMRRDTAQLRQTRDGVTQGCSFRERQVWNV